MIHSGQVGENPNDKMPPGRPLQHDELAPDFGEEQRRSEKGHGSGSDPSNADESGTDGSGSDRENQSGSGGVNPGKFT